MEDCSITHICNLPGHEDTVWHVDWSPDGKILASCGVDRTIRLWNCEGKMGDLLIASDPDIHKRTVRHVSWSPSGLQLAAASFDGTVSIWDFRSGQLESSSSLEGHENEVKCVAWSSGGNLLATCGRDKSVWVWEFDSETDDFECASVQTVHSQDVKAVRWHPSRDLLVSASYDDTIKIFQEELDEWTVSQTLTGHTSTVWSLGFSPAGDRLASVGDDRSIRIWEPDGRGPEAKWTCVCAHTDGLSRPVYSVSWCSLTNLIATGCGDNSIRVYRPQPLDGGGDGDSSTYNNQLTLTHVVCERVAHAQDVNCVSWNPQSSGMLASCSDDGLVKIWQVSAHSV